MSTIEELQKLQDKIMVVAVDIPEIVKSMDQVSEWNSIKEITDNIATITDLVKELTLVATYARQVLTDTEFDDKEVNKLVARIINDKVDLPWVPEMIEQKLFHIGVGMVMKTIQDLIENGMGDIKDLADKIRDKVTDTPDTPESE
jgi:hypothetical protein